MTLLRLLTTVTGHLFLLIVLFPPFNYDGTLLGGTGFAPLWHVLKPQSYDEAIDRYLWAEEILSVLMIASGLLLPRNSSRAAKAVVFIAWALFVANVNDVAWNNNIILDAEIGVWRSDALATSLLVFAVTHRLTRNWRSRHGTL